MPNKVLVLQNRKAGAKNRNQHVDEMNSALQTAGFESELCPDLDEFQAKAAELTAKAELFAVVAAGGDGTAAEAVNRTPNGTRVLLFPLGTENLLARYLKHESKIDPFIDLISNGKKISLDAGRANDKLFLLMIGVGFDAEVVRRLSEVRSGHITRFTYSKPLFDTIRSYRYPDLRVYCDEDGKASNSLDKTDSVEAKAVSFVAKWILGTNLPPYAIGLRFSPQAVGTDGLLDVCAFHNGSFFHGIKYFVNLITRRHLKLSDVTTQRCTSLRIESEDGSEVPFQLDGDYAGFLPVQVAIEPNRFTTMLTEQRAAELSL